MKTIEINSTINEIIADESKWLVRSDIKVGELTFVKNVRCNKSRVCLYSEITDKEKIEKEKEQQDWWEKQNNNDE